MLLVCFFTYILSKPYVIEGLSLTVQQGSTTVEKKELGVGETTSFDLTENQTLSLKLQTQFKSTPKNQVCVLELGVHSVTSVFNFRNGFLTLSFTPKKLQKLYKHSGVYDLKLMINDKVLDSPFFWNIAKVNFIANNEVVDNFTDVEWDFQPPKPTPKPIITQLFTIMMIGAFVILIILLFVNGINCGYFPHNFVDAILSLAFVVSLGAFFVFFVYFWKYITFVDMLKYILCAFVVLGTLLRFALVGRNKMVQKAKVQNNEKTKTE
ncbi:dolichyl-diphosphooligosaccharide--protein glycosyltransferase subunit 2 [Histomonas meleagridis]|uniref:dolichyl-diphosphooligosaccharide--protein glycosyltransferase subunit 2 n=1 Tax=Histomonas meleagridis TaxID=135588 RepID=UPI00355A2A05|nr:dolichyl-diphosphooligosaccharide--protein glycosyltransferase subunit 2 [Histomonas meleagridis]KAH0802303.1 dolichyl-diphosphooligosaccharide--protein glycosyltransferase subunit 2 [Histomonas meleagridis]